MSYVGSWKERALLHGGTAVSRPEQTVRRGAVRWGDGLVVAAEAEGRSTRGSQWPTVARFGSVRVPATRADLAFDPLRKRRMSYSATQQIRLSSRSVC